MMSSARVSTKRLWIKRVGWSLLGGYLFQFLLGGIAEFFNSPMLGQILFLPGWALVYAGRSSDPVWGPPVVFLINGVVYSPIVYLVYRQMRGERNVSIQGD